MKRSPLATLYAVLFVAISVSAWADGCLTAYQSSQNPGGQAGGIGSQSGSLCLDATCSSQYTIWNGISCVNSSCNPGRCASPATSSYCSGGMSNWTQQVYAPKSYIEECYTATGFEGCEDTGNTITNWYCANTGTQAGPPCYETWYNQGHSCGG